LTGLSGQFTRFAGFESGGTDFITKPVSPQALVSTIRALIDRPAQSQSKSTAIADK